MLRIPCPYCGLRDLTEFRYGGEAGVDRPENPSACSDQDWADYLYYRNNLKGPQRERWVHIHGCRQWFEIRRDTLTHEWLDDGKPAESSA